VEQYPVRAGVSSQEPGVRSQAGETKYPVLSTQCPVLSKSRSRESAVGSQESGWEPVPCARCQCTVAQSFASRQTAFQRLPQKLSSRTRGAGEGSAFFAHTTRHVSAGPACRSLVAGLLGTIHEEVGWWNRAELTRDDSSRRRLARGIPRSLPPVTKRNPVLRRGWFFSGY